MPWRNLTVFLIGIVSGFLGGLFGKGGSAIATPLLALLGIPGYIAVATPLPATIPGTFIAAAQYRRSRLLDWEVVWWGIAAGVPATILGSWVTKWTGSRLLLILTGLLILGFGLSFLFLPREDSERVDEMAVQMKHERPSHWHLRLILVSAGAGFGAGLLANAGGFLLAPGFARFLKQPLKQAFACSLAIACVLAIPGSLVHVKLGHVSWPLTAIIAVGMVPFSRLGAKTAIRTRGARLERWYGVGLTVLGLFFLWRL